MVPALSLGFLLAAERGGLGNCLRTRSATFQLRVCPGEEGETAAHTDMQKNKKGGGKKKKKKKDKRKKMSII